MLDNTEKYASVHLGKKSLGSEKYDSSLLVAIPRIENRRQYNIENESLPFQGFDIWHAYEFSVMTEKGLPITRVLKLRYNCASEFLIESKSLKLYLNSFNMSRFGENIEEALKICKNLIEKDLSNALKTPIEANFLDNNTQKTNIYSNFKNLMNYVNEKELEINQFKEAPEVLLTSTTEDLNEYYLTFDSLRSNCRVTHQPDFGDAFIYYKSKKHINEASLVKYLSSFRSEYHFHEECCEMIFKRLQDILDDTDELFVSALYTRRGGIDISPVRHTSNCLIKDAKKLFDLTRFVRYGIKQ